jgi:hypothetical protein
MIEILGMKVSRSALAAQERSGYYHGVRIRILRPLAKSQQAENNHEI